jgi:hypothetical protein
MSEYSLIMYTQFLLLTIVVFSVGCAKSPPETPKRSQRIEQNLANKDDTPTNVQQLQHKTDQILIALATQQYKNLPSLYNLATSGVKIAQQLLGKKLFGAYLDTWRVEHIVVTISTNGLTAQTQATTSYRMTSNQRRKHAIFKFHFSRPNKQSKWQPILTVHP